MKKYILGMPLVVAIAVSMTSQRVSAESTAFWYWLVGSETEYVVFADLKSIRRPGGPPNDDFWHIDVIGGPNATRYSYSFDCRVGHFFPDGEFRSRMVPNAGVARAAFELACAPPSMITKLMSGKI
jgi:hypothetical protein